MQCKDSLFFGLNSYSSIFSSDKPYSILLPSGLSGSISISAALCGSGEDTVFGKAQALVFMLKQVIIWVAILWIFLVVEVYQGIDCPLYQDFLMVFDTG